MFMALLILLSSPVGFKRGLGRAPGDHSDGAIPRTTQTPRRAGRCRRNRWRLRAQNALGGQRSILDGQEADLIRSHPFSRQRLSWRHSRGDGL